MLAITITVHDHARAAEAERRTVTPAASDAALREIFKNAVASASPDPRTGKPRDWLFALTTWLPNEWPPSPKTVWTRYAYGLDVTLDGVSGVAAPLARLERPSGEANSWTLVPMSTKLTLIGSHAVRPVGGWRYTKDDEQRVLTRALVLTGEPPPKTPATLELISYFKSWRLGNAEIAAHVAPQHRTFFAWLDKQ
jgi:hypothetical protein